MSDASQHPLVEPIYPTDIGFFPDAKYHYIERPLGSEQNVLICCVKGEGFVQSQGKMKTIKPDTLVVIPKGVPHTYGSDDKKPWSIFWVHFLGTNAQHYFSTSLADDFSLSVSMEKLSRVKSLFVEIIECFEKGYTKDIMIYVSQLLACLLGVLFYMNQEFSFGLKQENGRIADSIHYLSSHLDLTIALKELAEQANFSPTHYSFLFKKVTGFSPMDFFIRLKVQKACQYLDTTEATVKEIARSLGYNDPYYFSRVFHKVMQYYPSEYRKIKKG